MMFRVRCRLLFGLVVLLQVGCSCEKQLDKDRALTLQTKMENLIEKILRVIQDYYQQIRTELKCIPDEVPDTIIGTLKSAIDCVDHNEREFDNGRITSNKHKKNFLKCFSDAKTEVEETISSIDPNIDYCPENMTEKTYQINITTTFTKTFHINIKNGLEIMKKKVNMGNGEQICVFNQGEEVADKVNRTGKDLHSKEDHGKGPAAKEHHGKGPAAKEHHGKGPDAKEHHGKGPAAKEHHGKGPAAKEHHGKGPASKEDIGIGHESDNESDYSGVANDEDYLTNKPGNGEDSDYSADPYFEELYNKGHEPKEYSGKNPGSAKPPEYKEVTQIDENNENGGDVDDSYEDDDAHYADNDAHDDEDRHFLLQGKQDIINSSVDLAEADKKVKDKNVFSNLGPTIDDDHDFGNNDSGFDEEKFFFPDTTEKTKFTTQPANDMGDAKPPAEKTSDQDYYADPDTEPEDYNYGNEYYYTQDKEKNHTENFEEGLAHVEPRLGQAIPTTAVKQRIQIKPRNQIKQKPKKQQQHNGRRNIKLPKTLPKKLQSRQTPENQAPSSLALSFLQSDF